MHEQIPARKSPHSRGPSSQPDSDSAQATSDVRLDAQSIGPLTPARILELQRVLGNQRVIQLLRSQQAAGAVADSAQPAVEDDEAEQATQEAAAVPAEATTEAPAVATETEAAGRTTPETAEAETDESESEQPAPLIEPEMMAGADAPPDGAPPPAEPPPPPDPSQTEAEQQAQIDGQLQDVEAQAQQDQTAVTDELNQAAAEPLPSVAELMDEPDGLMIPPKMPPQPFAAPAETSLAAFDPQTVLAKLPQLPTPQPAAFAGAAAMPAPAPAAELTPPDLTPPQIPSAAAAPAGNTMPAVAPMLEPPALDEEAITGLVQRAPDQDGDNYDPAAARGEVVNMAGVLLNAPALAAADLQAQALALREQLTQQATTLKTTLEANFSASITRIQGHFTAQRDQLQTALDGAQSQIDTLLEAKIGGATARGQQAKTDLAGVVDEQKGLAQTAIDNSLLAVDEVRTRHKADAAERLGLKAGEARERGENKAGGYPSDERGTKQADAARRVATETAAEIEKQGPAFDQGIDDLLKDFPTEIQTKGQELLTGFDNAKPELDAKVDEVIQAVVTTLQEQARQLKEQLVTIGTELVGEIDRAEQSAIAGIQGQLPVVVAQVDGLVDSLGGALDGGASQAAGEIQAFAQQSHGTLIGIETPDVAKARTFIDQVLGFIQGAPGQVTPLFQEVNTQAGQQFTLFSTQANTSLLGMETTVAQEMQTAGEGLTGAFGQMAETVSSGFDTLITDLDTPFSEAETQVRDSLGQAISDFETGFNNTLTQADTEVGNAVNSGFTEIDNALTQMDARMEEAANDAAWRHDHPILAAIGDVAGFIGGLLLGLVAAIALAVAAIVIATALIAGLVALGLSSAVATAIVLIAGLALLAYGVYHGYTTRIAQGESGINALLGGFADVLGISYIINGFNRISQQGHVDFWSGLDIGFGAGVLGTLVFGNRLSQAVRARLPASLTNPVRGSAWRFFRAWRGRQPLNVNVPGRGGARPTWRQSEGDVSNALGDEFAAQQRFQAGNPLPNRGRIPRGASVPDNYRPGSTFRPPISVDVKNYNLTRPGGTNALVQNIVSQAQNRAANLPAETVQKVIIDVRGQAINNQIIQQIIDDIVQQSAGLIRRTDITIIGP